MKLNYKLSESTVKPSAVEMARKSVLIRRNIESVVRENENGEKTIYWAYEEACLSPEEFNAYVAEVSATNAINGVNDSGNIVKLLAGQSTNDNNQLILMQALVEMYELVATAIM